MRLIVGITGATGAIYGIRLLERLREAGAETHLVISRWGLRTLLHETDLDARACAGAGACTTYSAADMGAAISSGSFRTDGMIVAPCSAKTLGRHRARRRRQPHSPRCRCGSQGAPQARAGGSRGAAERHPSREHAQAVEDGRRDPPASPGLLQQSPDARRHRRSHRGADARSVRHRGQRCRRDGRGRWVSVATDYT